MAKERTPEEKRIDQIRSELSGLHRQIERLQIEKWKLEGYPEIPVSVSYEKEDGSMVTETINYTKEHYEGPCHWLSPDVPGRLVYGQELKGKKT